MAIQLRGKSKDLGGFTVTRVLPNPLKRMVGPFVFLDQMGPARFPAGQGIDVRPHPHIGLATVTYLLDGKMFHRDSLGNKVEILPGDVNWMTAGRGIVHSERQSIEVKAKAQTAHGLQAWVALPEQFAEIEPDFVHVDGAELPHIFYQEVQWRLIAGEAFGCTSPIKTYSPMFYLDVLAPAGKALARPNPDQECLVYVLDGSIAIEAEEFSSGDIVLLENEQTIDTQSMTRCILLGGKQWPDIPHIDWNFVSFSQDRLQQAKEDWENGKFPIIPSDDEERIPLPRAPAQ